jgi:hypothetical protein
MGVWLIVAHANVKAHELKHWAVIPQSSPVINKRRNGLLIIFETCVSLEFSTAVTMKNTVLWDVT